MKNIKKFAAVAGASLSLLGTASAVSATDAGARTPYYIHFEAPGGYSTYDSCIKNMDGAAGNANRGGDHVVQYLSGNTGYGQCSPTAYRSGSGWRYGAPYFYGGFIYTATHIANKGDKFGGWNLSSAWDAVGE